MLDLILKKIKKYGAEKKESGMTLVEVVIAFALISLITVVLIQGTSTAVKTLRINKARTESIAVANEKIELIRAMDYGFIEKECIHHERKLRYFGLPSEGLFDIIAWNDFISDIVAVERGSKLEPYIKQSLIISKALRLGFNNRLTLLRGDINDIIINDKDEVGTRVPYKFELINLDYGGSILYPDRERVTALEILVNRQRPRDFLLLITSNIREFDSDELVETQKRIQQYLTQIRRDLDENLIKYFEWINNNNSLLRQIIHLHFLVKNLAEQNRYEIDCYPALYYEGSKYTKLIHYIFKLRYQEQASTRVTSEQSMIHILNQKAKKLVEGKLINLEHPENIPLNMHANMRARATIEK